MHNALWRHYHHTTLSSNNLQDQRIKEDIHVDLLVPTSPFFYKQEELFHHYPIHIIILIISLCVHVGNK